MSRNCALVSGFCPGSALGSARLSFYGLTRLWLMWQSRWLNSDSTQIPNFLTWLNSDSTHLSQSWVKSDSRLITFYLIWPNVVYRGGVTGGGGEGVRSNVAVGCFFLCKSTNLNVFSSENQWLSFDSSSIQLTQLRLKWRSAWFDSDLTHILDFHDRLNSDSTHYSQSRVKFDSRLMSRAQPWSWPWRAKRRL